MTLAVLLTKEQIEFLLVVLDETQIRGKHAVLLVSVSTRLREAKSIDERDQREEQ